MAPLVTHSKDNHIDKFENKMFLQLRKKIKNKRRILQEQTATCYQSTIYTIRKLATQIYSKNFHKEKLQTNLLIHCI